ncbi:hypothetical protein AVEN_227729-1 [Araneus ventricosus]|uniref:Uncharacterized protein n=1 Tax=Araneus ventricosus TaxID=182803 RepID=A0A4Y2KIG2_ARAVE|nr:hypothetical protein AVEN_227729-1 [Araneus ventricosus]
MVPLPWRQTWRRNMGSQRCWNLLDISIRREDTLECARRFHVTSLSAAGDLYKEKAWMTGWLLLIALERERLWSSIRCASCNNLFCNRGVKFVMTTSQQTCFASGLVDYALLLCMKFVSKLPRQVCHDKLISIKIKLAASVHAIWIKDTLDSTGSVVVIRIIMLQDRGKIAV